MIINIEVKNRNGEGTIKLPRYLISEKEQPIGVVFGKFSPWTGENGHSRLINLLKKNGINKFYIVSPKRDDKIAEKYDANIFSPEARKKIVERVVTDGGFLGYIQAESNNVMGVIKELIHKIKRPVFVVGPDRETMFDRHFVIFGHEPVKDSNNKDFGKPEALVYTGPREVSGTLVRKSLVENDFETFTDLTKYDKETFEFMRNLMTKSFKQFYGGK